MRFRREGSLLKFGKPTSEFMKQEELHIIGMSGYRMHNHPECPKHRLVQGLGTLHASAKAVKKI